MSWTHWGLQCITYQAKVLLFEDELTGGSRIGWQCSISVIGDYWFQRRVQPYLGFRLSWNMGEGSTVELLTAPKDKPDAEAGSSPTVVRLLQAQRLPACHGHYRPGTKNGNADALSRCPIGTPDESEEEIRQVATLQPVVSAKGGDEDLAGRQEL